MHDDINYPLHYTGFSNDAQVIDITEHLSFNLGNVVKYVSRAGRKTADPYQDLRKAQFYLAREIGRLLQSDYERDFEELQDEGDACLPEDLYLAEGVIWVDSDGDEWRWVDNEGWSYRSPGLSGWIPVVGEPIDEYGPFKEKHG